MARIIEGELNCSGYSFGIVVSRFNEFLTSRLLEGALDCLSRNGAKEDDIDIIKVPGSFEIPYAAKKMISYSKYDSIICLGAIIRGDTSHHLYVSNEVSKGVASISLDSGVPVIFGVITADTIEQGIERAGTKSGNKGWDAALSAIEMVSLMRKIERMNK